MDFEDWGIFLGFVVVCFIIVFFLMLIIAPYEIKIMYKELEDIEQLRLEYVEAIESGSNERIDEAKAKYFSLVEKYNNKISSFPTSTYASWGGCEAIVIEQ
jgi:ABC-type bacteriocin/lantibiotic exporter with double-glycine peptidase domain